MKTSVVILKGLAFGLVLVCAALWGASVANAQYSPVSVSVRAGLNLNSLSVGKEMEAYDGSKLGFNGGVLIDYAFHHMLGVQSGLLFTTAGDKKADSYDKESVGIYELQVPVFAVFSCPITQYVRLKVNAGPTFSYGLIAKEYYQWKDYDYDDDGNESWKWEKDDPEDLYKEEDDEEAELQRFNLGLGFGLGVEIHKFYVGLGYDLGLTNLPNFWNEATSEDKKDYALRTRSLTFNVGYRF